MVHDYEERLDYAKRNTNLPNSPSNSAIDKFVYSVNERIVRGMI